MKFWVNIIAFLLPFWVSAQGVDSVAYFTVPLKATIVETDNVGNVYTAGQGVVKQFNLQGRLMQENSALALGEITSIDATNALKIQLFFGELSQITYLDNLLAPRGQNLSLDLNGYVQSTAVCRSYNDGFWLFDQTTLELIRLTEQFEITAQSGNLAQILRQAPQITYIREANNLLYAYDKEMGVLVFDWYGSYVKTLPFYQANKFAIFGNTLFTVKGNQLEMYQLKTGNYQQITLAVKDAIDFSVFNKTLVLLTKNELKFYRLNFN